PRRRPRPSAKGATRIDRSTTEFSTGRDAMTRAGAGLAGLMAALVATTMLVPAHAADAILSGTIAGPAGDKMGGVTVSAKADGSTITTTVYTDESGSYYFPPMPAGHYRVWAQALTFATADAQVDLAANKA